MKSENDKIQNLRERDRIRAIQFGTSWAERQLKNYNEPVRAGTPKGDPIGLSRKKYHTAIMMILYPSALKLREIAEITGVSEGVIRVWRTEKTFKETVKKVGKSLGTRVADEIDNIMRNLEIDRIKGPNTDRIGYTTSNDVLKILKSKKKHINNIKGDSKGQIKKVVVLDDLIEPSPLPGPFKDDPISLVRVLIALIPFFDISAVKPFFRSLKKNKKLGLGYVFIELALYESYIDNEESLRKWRKSPGMVGLTKVLIENSIDLLANPEVWEEFGVKRMKEIAKDLKEHVFSELDILAG